MSYSIAQVSPSDTSIPGYLFAGVAVALFALVQQLLSGRGYRGVAPTDERPVVFAFSRVWLFVINILALFLLVGPYLFPDSLEEQERDSWVFWLFPILAVLLVVASEVFRRTQRIEVFGNYFAFPRAGRRHEVRFAEVDSVEIIGTQLLVRLKDKSAYDFATFFARTPSLVSLLQTKAHEANQQFGDMNRRGRKQGQT